MTALELAHYEAAGEALDVLLQIVLQRLLVETMLLRDSGRAGELLLSFTHAEPVLRFARADCTALQDLWFELVGLPLAGKKKGKFCTDTAFASWPR